MVKLLFSLGTLAMGGFVTSLVLSSCNDNTAAAPRTENPPTVVRNAEKPALPAPSPTDTAADGSDHETQATAAPEADTLKKPDVKAAEQGPPATGLDAMAKASKAKKSLFLFFYKDDDAPTTRMRQVFEAAAQEAGDGTESFAVDTRAPSEKPILAKLGIGRAPMPLALVVAPNGAITGAFTANFTQRQLVDAIPSPCMEKCLKALQERKLVLLCMQNDATKSNDAAMRGIRDFKSDPRYAAITEVITMDPADAAEATTLKKLRVNPDTSEAMTVFLAPPGSIVGRFKGATSKSSILASLQRATSSACNPNSGCCSPRPKQ